MTSLEKSELYYPNKFGLIILNSLEEVMGKNGIHAILNLAGMTSYVERYPPDNLEKGFDFSELSAIGQALEGMYGPRAGRGLALRAGRATFSEVLRNFGGLAGVSDLALAVLPLQAKVRIGLNAFAKMFVQLTDQATGVDERGGDFIWSTYKCPYCWGRHGEQEPVCYGTVGLLQESLRWVSGGHEFRVEETQCMAVGDDLCEFAIGREPLA